MRFDHKYEPGAFAVCNRCGASFEEHAAEQDPFEKEKNARCDVCGKPPRDGEWFAISLPRHICSKPCLDASTAIVRKEATIAVVMRLTSAEEIACLANALATYSAARKEAGKETSRVDGIRARLPEGPEGKVTPMAYGMTRADVQSRVHDLTQTNIYTQAEHDRAIAEHDKYVVLAGEQIGRLMLERNEARDEVKTIHNRFMILVETKNALAKERDKLLDRVEAQHAELMAVHAELGEARERIQHLETLTRAQ